MTGFLEKMPDLAVETVDRQVDVNRILNETVSGAYDSLALVRRPGSLSPSERTVNENRIQSKIGYCELMAYVEQQSPRSFCETFVPKEMLPQLLQTKRSRRRTLLSGMFGSILWDAAFLTQRDAGFMGMYNSWNNAMTALICKRVRRILSRELK
ncbi:MAG: hypothetical protein QF741_02505 [Candidatus Peribacteraceae bacterium]|nr:hypothetical protein [Candidatus Peribacteraceae bacterium]